MKQDTVLQKGNEWYQVEIRGNTVDNGPYTLVEMRQRPIGSKKEPLEHFFMDQVTTPKAKSTKKAKTVKEGSKLSQAITLFKANKDMDRKEFIQLLMTNLNMTLAGATTYRYNAVNHCK